MARRDAGDQGGGPGDRDRRGRDSRQSDDAPDPRLPPGATGSPDDSDAADDDAPRREASVRLEVAGGTGGEAALRQAMDPANQSLADALRLSFRILQIAILGLLVTFLFSGFQTVQEGYTGVKTVFGAIQGEGADAQLAPGLEPFWPYPVGEIVVFESRRRIQLVTEFWPRLSRESTTIQRAIEAADVSNPLRPGIDGSVLTGDGDLAHLQVMAEYSVDDVSAYVSHVDAATAEAIVRRALMRGVVLAAAATPLNDLLADREPTSRGGAEPASASAPESKPDAAAGGGAATRPDGDATTAGTAADAAARAEATPAESGADGGATGGSSRSSRRNELEQLIRDRAQEVLDGLDCGIRLVSVSVPERLAPLAVENRFAQVQVAREVAKETVEKARQEARALLFASAGAAYAEILEGIRRYELALMAGDDAKADEMLALLGKRLEQPDIGGEAALLINRARAYQGAIQATLGADARRVEGLAATFRENPQQLVRQMRLDAIRQLFTDGQDQIEVFSVAPGVRDFGLRIMSSPDVMQSRRDSEMARKKQEADAASLMGGVWHPGVRDITPGRAGRILPREVDKVPKPGR